MGIYDRDYVRREGSGFLGSFIDRGSICKWLIGITVGAFVVQVLTTPAAGREGASRFTLAFLLTTDGVMHGQIWRLLTYAFLHDPGSPWPILWNMLFLWWFGKDLEDLYGPREFLTFYLGAVVLGGVAFVLTSLATGADPAFPYLTAAGPVAAVLVLCALHYPTRIIYLFFILPVPIWLIAVVQVAVGAYQFIGGIGPGAAGRGIIAAVSSVSLSAALFAFLYYKGQWRVSAWWPDLSGWRRRMRQPRLRVYREDEPATPVGVTPSARTAAPSEDDQLEAKMDAILEKISRAGKESLTESERQVLLRASEVFKRRRS
jgi:membrane associated rhomboid family serine protease